MWDLSNQFVVNAFTGGLLTLVLYIAIFKRSFRAIGIARKQIAGDRHQEWLFWCLGSTLFANVVAHFGVNYGPYMLVYLFVLLDDFRERPWRPGILTVSAKRGHRVIPIAPSSSRRS